MRLFSAIRCETLQWTIGGFCTLIGALMLVVPHQFSASTYYVLRPQLLLWGALFLVAGVALLLVAALRPSGWPVTAIHLVVGFVLLMLAFGFARNGGLTGALMYSVLGAGTILTGFLPAVQWSRVASRSGDALTLVVGSAAALMGLLFLFAPGLFGSPGLDAIRGSFTWYGVGFACGGVAVLFTQIRPSGKVVDWLGHLALAGAFCAFCLATSVPNRVWTGIALYGGIGTIVGLLPWLGPRLRAVDPSSLRVRLALALVGATALPLIVAIAVTANQEQQAIQVQALEQQRGLAVSLAQDIGDYVALHRAAVVALATHPGLTAMAPDAQRQLLRAADNAFPDVIAFSSFDARGTPIARSDSSALVETTEVPPLEAIRQDGRPRLEVLMSPVIRQPVLVLWMPVFDAEGSFAGLVEGAIASERVAQNFTRATAGRDTTAYLVDEQGRIVAHPNQALVLSSANPSSLLPAAELLLSPDATGVQRYLGSGGAQLAGYALLPELGWTVVVERPLAAALASTRARHDLLFGILLVIMIVAAAVGAFAAERLGAPLTTLTRAVSAVASGAAPIPLPEAGVTEVRQLAMAFDEMRDRLVVRTLEREQAESALRQSESSFRLLFGANPHPMWVYDLQTLRFLEVNQAATARYGYSREEFLAMRLTDIRPEEDVQRFVAEITAPRTAFRGPLEWRHRLKDGTVFDVEITSHTLQFGGRRAALVVAYDVTARKRAESDLRMFNEELEKRVTVRTAELQTAVRELEAFSYTVSHDLRAPLRAMDGFSRILLEDYSSQIPTEAQRYLGMVLTSAQNMGQLIDDLLAFSRLGRQALTKHPVDPTPLVQQVLADLQPEQEGRDLTIAIGPLESCTADPSLLRQVYANLLANALKFTRHRHPATVEVGCQPQDGKTVYFVRDNGVGFNMRYVDKLFGVFQRLHRAEDYEGTGVGLAIVQRIIQRHGGLVWAESAPNQGATFFFTLGDNRDA